ncbi:MAG: PKD domain-containing protein [Vicinamibacteria bacterium]|nr:PKD domain-containing protein [Vicinamibacteria bacterium]
MERAARTFGSLRAAGIVAGSLCAALALGGCEELPNLPPTASFIYSPVSPIYAGQTQVVFNASLSRDDDGRIVAYAWNFGDGSPELVTDQAVVTHVFPDTAARSIDMTYTVLLVVTDDQNETTGTSQQIHVYELPSRGARLDPRSR